LQGSLASVASRAVRAAVADIVPEKREALDEFDNLLDRREPHHTEAQIAAKKAAKGGKNKNNKRQPPDEFGPWDQDCDEFGCWTDPVEKREPHHTEAQIAAKKAAKGGKKNNKRHHTEAQIAAKKAAKAGKSKNNKRQPPDEFGPWDQDCDEFGCWTDPVEKREPHHTEAQIAAKKAAKGKKGNNKREPHHTEAQIAAKKAAGKGKKQN
jgi:hypothetical protein